MNPPQRFPVTRFRADSSMTGELFEMSTSFRSSPDRLYRFVWTLAPGKRGPGEHYHEDEMETFAIVSGTLRIWIEGVPRDYAPGDTVSIAPRVPHKFLNPGTVPVVVNVTLDGPKMEDAFVPLAVATHGRKATTGDLVRFLVVLADVWPSVPVARSEKAAMTLIVKLLKLFGVKRFEPVLGWDVVS